MQTKQYKHYRRRRNSFEDSFQDTEAQQLEDLRRQRAIQDKIALLVWTVIGSGLIGVIKWLS